MHFILFNFFFTKRGFQCGNEFELSLTNNKNRICIQNKRLPRCFSSTSKL